MNDTIAAISTTLGVGAIAIVRVSGNDAIKIVDKVFSRDLLKKASHTISYGYIKDNDEISLNGIEFLVLSIFSLLIQYIPKLLKIDENTYMLAGTYIFLIYYGIKNIII